MNLFPLLSKSGRLRTAVGIGAFKNEPPPGAAAPWPTASFIGAVEALKVLDVVDVVGPAVPQAVKSISGATASSRVIARLWPMSQAYVRRLELPISYPNI